MTWIRRLRSGAAAYGVAVVLGACAVAFLAFAAYLQLTTTLAPAVAALATGSGLLLLALLVVLVFRGSSGRSAGHRHRRRRDDPVDGLEELLEESVDPVLGRWLRRNPQRAALVMLLLGAGAGYSRSIRRVVQDLYNQYAETEKERRTSSRD